MILDPPIDAALVAIAEEKRPRFSFGLAVSVILHVLVACLLVYRLGTEEAEPASIPVDLVPVGAVTVPPQAGNGGAPQRQAALQQPAQPPSRRAQANPNPVSRMAPSKEKAPTNDEPTPPRDELQTKLEELAKLKQPQSDPRAKLGLDRTGEGLAGQGHGPGDEGSYSIKDYIRQQVERRWSLDFAILGNRKLVVLLHLMLKRDGSVESVEIVNNSDRTDAVYRSIAISARNAVILSSPFNLPPGTYEAAKDMVLDLNPRDTMR
jgi:hypothetical protein